jgi:hypothetical protein
MLLVCVIDVVEVVSVPELVATVLLLLLLLTVEEVLTVLLLDDVGALLVSRVELVPEDAVELDRSELALLLPAVADEEAAIVPDGDEGSEIYP